MSLLGSIVSKILHPMGGAASPVAPTADAGGSATSASPSGTPASPAATGSTTPASGTPVDVDAVLTGMAEKKGETLNWRTSIVDLLKVLDLDSSLTARKQLADELHFTGDKDDSASMNVWLHKQVVKKLEENGGKVPADLKD